MRTKLNQKGQATIESILIMTALLGVCMLISQTFTSNNYFSTLIEGPWDYVDGIVRDGVWMKASTSHASNPNAIVRHATKKTTSHTNNSAYDQAQIDLVL